MSSQIEIKLLEKQSRKDGSDYYIGSTDMPVSIDLSKVTIMVFHPLEGTDRATLIIRARRPPKKPKSYNADYSKKDYADEFDAGE